jgi:osmotically-inducible protein OsmY
MRGSEEMCIAFKNREGAFQACLAAVACGLIGVATRVSAQNAPAPISSRPVSIEASSTQAADLAADEKPRKRVVAALHADPYSYDKHVTVSIENGVVVLHGFVFSDWDLRQALNIARKAAGAKTVVDNVSIKEGGR